jgi:hypothetical protein
MDRKIRRDWDVTLFGMVEEREKSKGEWQEILHQVPPGLIRPSMKEK